MVIYNYNDIENILKKYNLKKYSKAKTKNSEKISYYDIPMAFDIETTSFYEDDEKRAIMYIWQMAIFDNVIIGRTWEEFNSAIDLLSKILKTNTTIRAVIYVHNLGYEYEFIKHRLHFIDVFSRDDRTILKAVTDKGIEFRCSYALTNKKLELLAQDLKHHKIEKKVGDLDYSLIRTSKTPITKEELDYCVNDVLLLSYYISEKIEEEHLSTIPLTSTGYVRRMCKQAYRHDKDWRNLMKNIRLTPETYGYNKKVYQGAYVHGNILYTDKTLEHVGSWDFDSSYIAVLIGEKYPLSSPHNIKIHDMEQFKYYISRYNCIFTLKIEGLKLKDNKYISPISESKCDDLINPIIDNGRVVSADNLIVYITEIDYILYSKIFDWKKISVGKFYYMDSGYLPTGLIEVAYGLYKQKKALKPIKDIGENKYVYNAIKSLLNAIYGMCATDIQHGKDIDKAVDDYNKGYNFLYPLWSTYITAYARRNLFSGICATGDDFIYSDTDSVKVLNPEDHFAYIEKYNKWIDKKIEKACQYHGLNFEDIKGIGRWDFEGIYDVFKCLRAKAYMTLKDNKYNLTMSGVSKDAIKYITSTAAPFEFFSNGLKIPPEHTGKLTHIYVDHEINGTITDYKGVACDYHEYSYVHMEPVGFKLDYTDDYLRFISICERIGIR